MVTADDDITVHFEPIVFICRVYGPGCSFEHKSPYLTSANIQICADMAFVSGVSEKVTRRQYIRVLQELEGLGVKTVASIRNGKWKFREIGGGKKS